MSGHGRSPIFFNKRNKDWMSWILANPSPPYVWKTSDFCLILPRPPWKWTTYMYHPLKYEKKNGQNFTEQEIL